MASSGSTAFRCDIAAAISTPVSSACGLGGVTKASCSARAPLVQSFHPIEAGAGSAASMAAAGTTPEWIGSADW
ncbi:hypothetical protein D3C81_2000260 [compost metagenome]